MLGELNKENEDLASPRNLNAQVHVTGLAIVSTHPQNPHGHSFGWSSASAMAIPPGRQTLPTGLLYAN